MSGFSQGRLSFRREWSPGLVTLGIDAEIEPFQAGQFANVGLYIEGEFVRRAYSLASAPGQRPEFYLNSVSSGVLSPLLSELPVGGEVHVERKAQGFFTLAYVPPSETMWFIGTGTGLAPFISMLRTAEPWQRFRRLVVVHGVRQAEQLSYRDELVERSRAHADQLIWVPVVSREPEAADVIHGRITGAIESGELERFAGLALSPAESHVMLCGNPQMIQDVTALLEQRGLRKHRVRRPGHISTEKYW